MEKIFENIKLLYDAFKQYSDAFYNELLRLDFAVWVFALTGFISLLVVVSYYYIIDRPRTTKLWVWFVLMALCSVPLSFLAYSIANNTIIDDYLASGYDVPDYFTDLIYFSVMNFIIASLFFFLFSVLLKWWSRNSSHVPF